VATAELLAKILDTTVKIPGTPFYIGLDPLLGLIPGLGDILANLIGPSSWYWPRGFRYRRLFLHG
jgi:hypothetical protein